MELYRTGSASVVCCDWENQVTLVQAIHFGITGTLFLSGRAPQLENLQKPDWAMGMYAFPASCEAVSAAIVFHLGSRSARTLRGSAYRLPCEPAPPARLIYEILCHKCPSGSRTHRSRRRHCRRRHLCWRNR
jgi:hypothetical protein